MTQAAQKQIVFIAGAGHSGSTLLDMCLGGHSQVASLGETGFLYYYAHRMGGRDVCTCGATIEECPFWCKTAQELAVLRAVPREKVFDDFILSDPAQVRIGSNGEYLDRMPDEPVVNNSLLRMALGVIGIGALMRFAARFSKTVALRAQAARNRMLLFDAVLAAHDKKIVLDSTKSPGSLKEAWMLRGVMPIKFIALRRDGRGVAASDKRRNGIGMCAAARRWRNEMLKWRVVAMTIPSADILDVRYEDLTSDPVRELTRICGFLGIAYEPGMLSFRDDRHNLGGNPMRFRNEERKIEPDMRWKSELANDDLLAFEKEAGWLNRMLGYDAV